MTNARIQIGEKLYQIIDQIGSGAFGTVYKAQDIEDNNKIVINL